MKTSSILATLTLTLDRPRELSISLDVLAKYEKATGRRFFGSKKAAPIETADDLLQFVLACAQVEDPSVTAEQLEPFITSAVLGELADALTRFTDSLRRERMGGRN